MTSEPEPEYRVVRRTTPDGADFQFYLVQEAHDGTFSLFGGPVVVEAESTEGLRVALEVLEEAAKKPILEFDQLHWRPKKELSTVRALDRDTSVIPMGYYCYQRTPRGKLLCPYWQSYEYLPSQANGFCWYLRKGDIELQKERHHSLLWDLVKECGVNPRVSDPAEDRAICWVVAALNAYIKAHFDVDRIFVDFEIDPVTKRKVIRVSSVNGIENPNDENVHAHFRQLDAVFAASDVPYQDLEPDSALSVGRNPLLPDDDEVDRTNPNDVLEDREEGEDSKGGRY